MATQGSVTNWLNRLQAGDHLVAQRLWEGYFARLVGLARAKLQGKPRTLSDPEDVALSAFKSFCLATQQGRFPKLNDRQDLWQVLVMLTARKAIDALRREQALKRDGEVAPKGGGDLSDEFVIENLVGHEPTPSFAAEVGEQCQRLLNRLPDDELRTIAVLKLEGFTNEELVARLGRSLATIERKLALIRRYWDGGDEHG